MSNREVISRHLFSWQTFWSSCSIWRQHWLSKAFHLAFSNLLSAKMMLELASKQIAAWPNQWSLFTLKNSSVWNPAQSSGAGSSSDGGKGDVMTCHDWGFYQMKRMECSKSHFSLFGECCSFELWMIQGTRRKLPSLDAAVSPRQGDDGYIIDIISDR